MHFVLPMCEAYTVSRGTDAVTHPMNEETIISHACTFFSQCLEFRYKWDDGVIHVMKSSAIYQLYSLLLYSVCMVS